ncbi:rhomboid family intramembrane serine protease [Tessaracoccus sp. OH4464_COT-324]|nr:rhomboid family intramembrane serine protease [Tessaracoccus sp. OH4464_COT-324]
MTALVPNLVVVGIMWVLEVLDALTPASLDSFGILPRDFTALGGILAAPWLHVGWGHLLSNSVPFILLGTLILLSGWRNYLTVTVLSVLASGIVVWLIAPAHTVTLGASGVVFGYLAYVLVRGLFSKQLSQILIAVLVFVVYGGLLWGVLPTTPGVSWQAHLGGAIGGVLAAWLIYARPVRSGSGTAG